MSGPFCIPARPTYPTNNINIPKRSSTPTKTRCQDAIDTATLGLIKQDITRLDGKLDSIGNRLDTVLKVLEEDYSDVQTLGKRLKKL